MRKRILITGAAGFLGSHLCDRFIRGCWQGKEYNFRILDCIRKRGGKIKPSFFQIAEKKFFQAGLIYGDNAFRKLFNLDEYIDARRNAADIYDKGFSNNDKITVPFRADDNRHVFHQYTLVLNGVDRDGLHAFLAEKGIPSMIYYPVPAHRQKMFEHTGGNKFSLPVTDWLTERVISLPIHTELDKEQQLFIIDHVLQFVNR